MFFVLDRSFKYKSYNLTISRYDIKEWYSNDHGRLTIALLGLQIPLSVLPM